MYFPDPCPSPVHSDRLLDTGIQCITLPAEVEEYLSEAIQALQHIVGTPGETKGCFGGVRGGWLYVAV